MWPVTFTIKQNEWTAHVWPVPNLMKQMKSKVHVWRVLCTMNQVEPKIHVWRISFLWWHTFVYVYKINCSYANFDKVENQRKNIVFVRWDGAIIVNSHTFFKVKENDGSCLYFKEWKPPYRKKNNLRFELLEDSTICLSVRLSILELVFLLMGWTGIEANAKTAFLQAGAAMRDVYVKPPSDCKIRNSHLWNLLPAVFGLVSPNAKWHVMLDLILYEFG